MGRPVTPAHMPVHMHVPAHVQPPAKMHCTLPYPPQNHPSTQQGRSVVHSGHPHRHQTMDHHAALSPRP